MNLRLRMYLWTFSVVISMLASAVSANGDYPLQASEICKNQPQCDFTAVDKQWPSTGFDSNYVTFTNRIFDVRLPKAMDKVSIGWGDTPLYALWFDEVRVAIGIEDVPDVRAGYDHEKIIEDKKDSNWIGIDLFKIVFNNKPYEKEPANAYEKYLWRSAFFHKVIVYDGIKAASIYKHGPWTAYSATVSGPTPHRLTIITHADIEDQYLSIRDNGLDQEFLEKIIASVSLNK